MLSQQQKTERDSIKRGSTLSSSRLTILFPNTLWLYHGIKIGRIALNRNAALGPLWQSLTATDPGSDRVRYSSHQ